MKVKELIEQLMRCNLEDEVVIKANYTFTTAGPIASTEIKGASSGFDWDKGKVIISASTNLIQLNDAQYSIFLKELYNNDWIKDDISKGKNPRGKIHPMFNPGTVNDNTD